MKLKNIVPVFLLSVVLTGCGLDDVTNMVVGNIAAGTEESSQQDDQGDLWSPIDGEANSDALAPIAEETLIDENFGESGSEDIADEAVVDESDSEVIADENQDGRDSDDNGENTADVTEDGVPSADDINSELAEGIKESENKKGILSATSDINLRDIDGAGTNYLFTYGGEDFSAGYTTDNWKIINSYKIDNTSDITIICQALIDVHPIHGSDMASYRTADDMAYEWVQHNLAYQTLPDDSPLKSHAKDVDLDPNDQNRSFDEIYKDRTGKELDLNDFISEDDLQKLYDMLSGD